MDLARSIQTIDRALAHDAPLRHRAEGVSWIVWGLVTATNLLAFELSGTSYRGWYSVVAFTWPVTAVLATSAVWRLAGVARPALDPSRGRMLAAVSLAAVAILLTTLAGYFVYAWTGSWLALAAALPALPWALLAALQWGRMTAPGRRAMIIAAGVMAASMATWAGLFLQDTVVDFAVMVAVSGGIPFALGSAWVFRR